MTSKEFKIWLDGFLTPLNLENTEVRSVFGTDYNHLTMLKTIHNKMKNIKDLDETLNKGIGTLLTERLVPVTPPNPFTITCEDKKENNE
jgi:hypothetical protein|tara:strand:- start:4051 stop:4317 length:267 start_codon:yes stop_codon:yes gene_type:complete